MYLAWRVVTVLVRFSPRRLSYGVAFVAGTVAFYCWPRGRRSMLRNYRCVLPAADRAEIRRIARRSLVNYCRYLVDFVRFPFLSAADLRASVGGEEAFRALDRALERGKGAIIVCTHFGSWDMGAGAAAARGYHLTVVAETFADARLDRMIVGARERIGMQVVKMEKVAPSLLRSLKHNGLLALLIDRPMAGDGVKVNFFGREVEVPAGPARLALRSGAAVVPTAFACLPGAPPVVTLANFDVEVQRTGDEARDVVALTQAIMTAHEAFIREHPDQWYMFREMWPRPASQGVR